jgi:SAM-dependent methyltransferase
MPSTPATQYATDVNLRARQRLWAISRRDPAFELFPWVVDLAGVAPTDDVLDVGCGNGSYLELVRAVGLDLSIGMLDAARRRTSGPLVCASADRLPLHDASFDVVLAPHMLYHVDDRISAVRELRRVLRPGGTCVAVTNGEANHAELVRMVEDVVGRGWRWQRPADTSFSLENGGAQLRSAFASVERVDCPASVVSVDDADALADYVASVGDHYAAEVAGWTTWAAVVEECRARASRAIAGDGAFTVTTSVGAFLCS